VLFNTNQKALYLWPEFDFEKACIRIIFEAVTVAADIKTAARGLVVSNPGTLGGEPVFRGTRLPVKTLFDYLADGLTLDYFLDTFEGVTRDQAQDVLRYGFDRIVSDLKG
jgi:uncharacterized protein (DUF433 family)